jgi:hypothetical protein
MKTTFNEEESPEQVQPKIEYWEEGFRKYEYKRSPYPPYFVKIDKWLAKNRERQETWLAEQRAKRGWRAAWVYFTSKLRKSEKD